MVPSQHKTQWLLAHPDIMTASVWWSFHTNDTSTCVQCNYGNCSTASNLGTHQGCCAGRGTHQAEPLLQTNMHDIATRQKQRTCTPQVSPRLIFCSSTADRRPKPKVDRMPANRPTATAPPGLNLTFKRKCEARVTRQVIQVSGAQGRCRPTGQQPQRLQGSANSKPNSKGEMRCTPWQLSKRLNYEGLVNSEISDTPYPHL